MTVTYPSLKDDLRWLVIVVLLASIPVVFVGSMWFAKLIRYTGGAVIPLGDAGSFVVWLLVIGVGGLGYPMAAIVVALWLHGINVERQWKYSR